MTCSKCEEEFCVTHQLPESHKCPKIDLYKKDIVDLVAIKPSKLEYIWFDIWEWNDDNNDNNNFFFVKKKSDE